MRAAVGALVIAGCWHGAAPEEPALSHSAPETELLLTEQGLGPFGATTVAKLPDVKTSAPQFEVRAHDLGGEAGVVFNVYRGGTKIAYVVPDDAPGWTDDEGSAHQYASTMFAVFAVSSSVRVVGRSWRVGSPLDDIRGLEACECWGDHDVTACLSHTSHIEIVFDLPCDDAERVGPRAMQGHRISRIMWKRELPPPPTTEE